MFKAASHSQAKPSRGEATNSRRPLCRTFALIAYLVPLLSIAFVTRVSIACSPKWGDVLLCAVGILAFVSCCHFVLAILVRKSPATEIVLCLLVGFVFLSPFLIVSIPTTYRGLSLAGLGLASGVGAGVACKRDQQQYGRTLGGLVAAILVAGIVMQTVSIAGSAIPDACRNWRADQGVYLQAPLTRVPTAPAAMSKNNGRFPDIYYIILDAYGRSDVLQRLYGFDNSEFLNELRARGFFVASRSRSNYQLTELSIASSLNLSYLNGDELQRFHTRLPLQGLISDSILVRTLKRLGYETVAFQSGKATTECESFDYYLSPSRSLSDFQDVLFHSTALATIFEAAQPALPYWPSAIHRERIARTFAQLPHVAQCSPAPKFVFAHIMAPHPPFVFDEHGHAANLHGRYLLADSGPFHAIHDRVTYLAGYRRQVQYVNSQVLSVIDRIQTHASRPAVIVIQGDHGPRSAVDVSNPDNSDIQEALGVLLAVGPSVDAAKLYHEITPVNIFRIVLNSRFGSELEPLEDKCCFETPMFSYRFRDVTDAASAPGASRSIGDGETLVDQPHFRSNLP